MVRDVRRPDAATAAAPMPKEGDGPLVDGAAAW